MLEADNAQEFLRHHDPGCDIISRPSFLMALQELSSGRYDAVVIQHLLALQLIGDNGLTNLEIVAAPLHDFKQEFCFGVTEGDRVTLALLNEGLALVMADGTAEALTAKWLGNLAVSAPPSVRMLLKYSAMVVVPILLVILLATVTFLRREIRRRTAELVESRDRATLSEQRFRSLFNNLADSIFVHSIDENGLPGRMEQVNDSASKLLGYSRAELLAMSPIELNNDPAGEEHIGRAMERIIRDKHLVFESSLTARDERRIPVEVNANLIRLNGAPLVLSVVRDLTLRKKDEEQLRQLTSLLEQLSILQSSYIASGSVREIFSGLLDSLVKITGSPPVPAG